MKNKIIYLVLLLLLSTATTPILAQEQCDTEVTQAQMDYMNATREARESFKASKLKSNQVYIVPMIAHIIRRDDATGGLTKAQLNIAMVQLNEAFEQADFEFELCEINYIDNSDYMTITSSQDPNSDEFTMATNNRVADKVNVFFVHSLKKSSGTGSLCGSSSFPSYLDHGEDWIMMKNSCTTDGSSFAHELGHWFNLYHTFQGVSEDLDVAEKELVVRGAGQNCGQIGVGDELCDTPADPGLSTGNVTPDCIYVGTEEDADDDMYTPDVSNIMTYGQKACRTFFSPEQIQRMRDIYEFVRMSSLSACTTSLDCEITSISVSNTTTCNDNGTPDDITDDYFEGDVTVNYFGMGTGHLYARVAGDYDYKFTSSYSANTHTFTGIRMPANGLPVGMTAYFHAQPDCSFIDDNVHRGISCYPCNGDPNCDPCNMGLPTLEQNKVNGGFVCYDNGTDDATDDFFRTRIRIARENWPTSGTLEITGDVQLSIPVSQLNNDDEYHYLPYTTFPSNGQPITLTATFSDGCSTTNTVGGEYPCSKDCEFRADLRENYPPISGYYFKEVHHYFYAYNKILNGADATYDAGVRIKLGKGFHAENGSKFHAYIDGCPDNVGAKEEPLASELDTTLGYLRNYPNPFTGQTTIEFVLTQDTPVTLFVSDVTGKQVAVLLNNDEKTQGTHSITFDGNNYPAGMYYYTIQAGDLYGTQKMILAK